MDIAVGLDRRSPIIRRALRIRESIHTDAALSPSPDGMGMRLVYVGDRMSKFEDGESRGSRRQDWNKLERAPLCGILLTCSARSQAEPDV